MAEGRVPKRESIFDHPDIWYGLEEDYMAHEGGCRASAFRDLRYFLRLYKKFGKGRLRSLLEVACGNCPHGRLLAKSDVDVVGIDYSEPMLKEAVKKAREEKTKVRVLKRSTERFRLPKGTGPFDAALCLSETPPYGFEAKTGDEHSDAMVTHLRCVGRVLRPGAIYALDWGRILSHEPQRLHEETPLEDRTVDLGHALVHKKVHVMPQSIAQNIQTTHQRTRVLYKKTGKTLDMHDTWRQQWLRPSPMYAALVEISGCFDFLGAFEADKLTPGISGQPNVFVWALLRRNDKKVPPDIPIGKKG